MKENLITRISNNTGLKSTQVKCVMDNLVSLIVEDLQNKADVNILGLCKFKVTEVANVSLGTDNVEVGAKVKIKPSSSLVDKVNEGYGKTDYLESEIDEILSKINKENGE